MWRIAKNLLPTASNLWKRKIVMELVCQRCGRKSEDVFHALLDCKAARRVWKLTEFYEDMKLMARQEIARKRKKKEDIELIVAICWAIWHLRNLLIFEGKQEDSQLLVIRAAAIAESYQRIKSPNDQAISKYHRSKQQTWTSPQVWYKVNVDAAIKNLDRLAGLGVVIRDFRGKIVAATVNRVLHQGNVACMEAVEVVCFGIQNAIQVNSVPMIIEFDSSEVVDLSLNRKSSIIDNQRFIGKLHKFN